MALKPDYLRSASTRAFSAVAAASTFFLSRIQLGLGSVSGGFDFCFADFRIHLGQLFSVRRRFIDALLLFVDLVLGGIRLGINIGFLLIAAHGNQSSADDDG